MTLILKMKKGIICLLLIFSFICFIFADQTESVYEPILALEEAGPYMPISGFNSPLIVLYENGLLIYATKSFSEKPIYVYRMLNTEELDKVKSKIMDYYNSTLQERHTDNAQSTWTTDGTTTYLYMNVDGKKCSIKSYGLRIRFFDELGFYDLPDRSSKLNDSTWEIYTYIVNLAKENGDIWYFDEYKIVASKQDYVDEKAIKWSSDWNRNGINIITEKNGDFIIFVKGFLYNDFKQYLSDYRFMIMNKKNYFLMPIEPVFYSSQVWRNWKY